MSGVDSNSWADLNARLAAAVARAEKAEADADRLVRAVLANGPWGHGLSPGQTQMLEALAAHDAAVAERGGTVSTDWYWCVTHRRAEQDDGSNGHTHVGPLFTKAEAEAWAQRWRPVTERDEL